MIRRSGADAFRARGRWPALPIVRAGAHWAPWVIAVLVALAPPLTASAQDTADDPPPAEVDAVASAPSAALDTAGGSNGATDVPATLDASAVGVETPATVTVWGRELATFRTNFGEATPAARALAAQKRVERILGQDPRQHIRLQPGAFGGLRGVVVIAGDDVLFGLLEGDMPEGASDSLDGEARLVLARVRRLSAAMARQQEPMALLRSIAESVPAVVGLFLLFWLIRRQLRPAARRRSANLARRVVGRFGSRTIPPGIDLDGVATGAVRTAASTVLTLIELVATFLCAGFVLRRFPYTQALGEALARRLIDLAGIVAAAFVAELPNLLAIVVIALIARSFWRLAQRWTTAVEEKKVAATWLDSETAGPTRKLFGVAIWTAAVVVAYPFIPGSGSDAFKGVSVLIGVMVSLGGSSIVGQVIAGLVVLYSRAARRGDFVQVGDTEGTIVALGLLSTRLLTPQSELVNIPSSVMVTAISRNTTSHAAANGSVLRTAVTIGYDAPWRQVHGLLLQAASRTPGVLPAPEPRVLQRGLGDFYVEYELVLQVDRHRDRYEIASILNAAIQDAFNTEGVQIMSPHFFAQPEQPVVVPPETWAPPGAARTIARTAAVAAAKQSVGEDPEPPGG